MKGVERKMLLEAAMALKESNQEPILTHHLATPMHVAAAKEYMDVLRSACTRHTQACTIQCSSTHQDKHTGNHAHPHTTHNTRTHTHTRVHFDSTLVYLHILCV